MSAWRFEAALLSVVIAVCLLVGSAAGLEPVRGLGPGTAVLVTAEPDRSCVGTEDRTNADGSYENGFGVRWNLLRSPDYGAFAECFQGESEVCAVLLDLCSDDDYWLHPPQETTLDAYIWADDDGRPGAVLSVRVGYHPETNPVWPEYAHHVVQLPPGCRTGPSWWAGAWWNWGDDHSPFYWYLMADVDGHGGCPLIKIPPDYGGYPSGWHSVSTFWGPTAAVGIGVQTRQMLPSALPEPPSEGSTWGRVKALYRD